MSELINVIVAIGVIYFVVRWATSSSESPEDRNIRAALGFRPKKVTPEMVDTISAMFPNLPRQNIHYDLLRTGDVEMTTNKIIERGFLDVPSTGYFRIHPRTNEPSSRTASPSNIASNATASSSSISGAKSKNAPSLIERFNLEKRVSTFGDDGVSAKSPEEAGGKATWETTAEQREASLRERKAQMILAARRRMMEQQQKASGSGSNSNAPYS